MILSLSHSLLFFFFFQAEDGIRDPLVTGVQTCALPISAAHPDQADVGTATELLSGKPHLSAAGPVQCAQESQQRAFAGTRWAGESREARSEERRVGKECREWWGGEARKKKKRYRKEWRV